MNTRRNVKISVNMFDDTKLKIIDTKPERDLIHYIWFRIVTLAGKVNRDGELYLSRNIPYTPETFAIEFNRGTYQINLALDILIELEMIDIVNKNVYRVRNFSKHQNGTRKVKDDPKVKEEKVDNIINEKRDLKANMTRESVEDKEDTNNERLNKKEKNRSDNKKNSNKDIINKAQAPISIGIDRTASENDIIINSDKISEKVKSKVLSKKHPKKNKKNSIKTKLKDIKEIGEEEEILTFYDGELKIKDGTVINSWNFDNTR